MISAVGAVVAAFLSGMSLLVLGRRENVRWRREALVDTVVSFIDASFTMPGHGALRRAQSGNFSAEDREEVLQADQRAGQALSRLRVIATAETVQAAELIHALDNRKARMVLTAQVAFDEDEWTRTSIERREARVALLTAARRELRLGPASTIREDLLTVKGLRDVARDSLVREKSRGSVGDAS